MGPVVPPSRAAWPALPAVLALAALVLAACDEPGRPPAGGPVTTTNRLARERSPYLRQHQTNPVDWYPWGEEAFARARAEGRPVLLSVGYAACHWCHVMEHESFEDAATAKLLNETFVCVKVDREERPDVDALYMQAVHVMSGRGGWPMTVLLTPAGDPFFAATYLPRPALRELARRVAEAWRTDRPQLEAQAGQVAEHVRALGSAPEAATWDGEDEELLEILHAALRSDFDAARGGYGGRPKFPPHTELLYLLDRIEGGVAADGQEAQVRRTLDAMADGGVHDQVGGGFHRYSTDAVWLLPHFEKMLYDNALLAQAYARAAALLGEPRYASVARDVLDWIRREMARPGGGYASSLDADTAGEEGLTYTWTEAEVREALDPEDADLAIRVYGIRGDGNFVEEATAQRTGRNVLHLPVPLATVAGALATDGPALEARLERVRRTLRAAREARLQPGLDDKVITAWNGLLLSGFAAVGRALGDEEALTDGRRLATFLLDRCRLSDGTLLRFPRDGGPEVVGFLEDHVHLATGLLDLAEATREEAWATAAADLAAVVVERFEDRAAGGFWSTAEGWHETLFARQKKSFDDPIPSENGVAAHLLLRVAARGGPPAPGAAADRALAAWRPLLAQGRAARGLVAIHRALFARSRAVVATEGAQGDVTVRGDVLGADLFLERSTIAPGGRVALALRLVLEDGWHVNPTGTATDTRIPTTLGLAGDAPASLEEVRFPPPTRRALAPGQDEVDLHEGVFWVRAALVLPVDAPTGPLAVPLALRVQPCDDRSCLAPRDLVLSVPILVASADGAPRHPDLFPSR